MVCQLVSNVCGQMQICRNKKHRVAKTVKYTRINMGKCELLTKNVLELPQGGIITQKDLTPTTQKGVEVLENEVLNCSLEIMSILTSLLQL